VATEVNSDRIIYPATEGYMSTHHDVLRRPRPETLAERSQWSSIRWAGHVAFVLAASVMLVLPLAGQERYDIVLRNGRVMDPETGLDAVRNVGIRGSVIAAISEEPLAGDAEINASGLVIAPGFIDLHAHGQSNRGNEFQARDGVTTALELEDGVPDVAAFLETRGAGSVLNYGTTISHMAARTWIMPHHAEAVARAEALLAEHDEYDEDRLLELYTAAAAGAYDSLSPDQMGALRERLDGGLSQGALGIGMAHQYYPGATHEEIFRVFQMAAEWQTPIFTHVREMSIAAMQEVIANAAATGAPLHIVHVNSSSLWNIGPVLDLIGSAQARGIDVTTEAYPYTAASTLLESAIFDVGWQDRVQKVSGGGRRRHHPYDEARVDRKGRTDAVRHGGVRRDALRARGSPPQRGNLLEVLGTLRARATAHAAHGCSGTRHAHASAAARGGIPADAPEGPRAGWERRGHHRL
jgi:hypothetical protein